jgi:small subunit ribosomal protein S18
MNQNRDMDRDRDLRDREPRSDKDGGGFRRQMRRRGCMFCSDEALVIDYKDPQSLRYFVTDRGKIVPRRISGNCAKHQRAVTLAVKQARSIALLPFTANE